MRVYLPLFTYSCLYNLNKYMYYYYYVYITETKMFGDGTHLRGMRGTAVGVEAAVTTCKICSRADKPPPTWKAT